MGKSIDNSVECSHRDVEITEDTILSGPHEPLIILKSIRARTKKIFNQSMIERGNLLQRMYYGLADWWLTNTSKDYREANINSY